jgi:NADPH:quinone reductase-like Zn-dependent oxidoreductase
LRRRGNRRGDEPGDVLVDRAALADRHRARAARARPRRDRQRRSDGRRDRQAPRRGPRDRRRPRRAERLAALGDLGADVSISLAREDAYDALGQAAADVDVVIDYLWGTPAERAIRALVTRRHDRSRPLDWIEVGSVAGPDITLPSAALRAANVRIMGSGQGSVATAEIVAQLPALAAEITAGTLTIDAAPVPLSQVETAWNAAAEPGQRIVFTP